MDWWKSALRYLQYFLARRFGRSFERLRRLGKAIDEHETETKKNGIYLLGAALFGVGTWLFWFWDSVLPVIGLRDTVRIEYEGQGELFMRELDGNFNGGPFNPIQGGKYRFSVALRSIGEKIGGQGSILVARDKEGKKVISDISENLPSFDSIAISYNFLSAPYVRKADLPAIILVCVWQSAPKLRIVPVSLRLADENTMDSAIPGIRSEGGVSYVPWVVIPKPIKGSFEECQRLVAHKEEHSHDCIAFAKFFDRAKCPQGVAIQR